MCQQFPLTVTQEWGYNGALSSSLLFVSSSLIDLKTNINHIYTLRTMKSNEVITWINDRLWYITGVTLTDDEDKWTKVRELQLVFATDIQTNGAFSTYLHWDKTNKWVTTQGRQQQVACLCVQGVFTLEQSYSLLWPVTSSGKQGSLGLKLQSIPFCPIPPTTFSHSLSHMWFFLALTTKLHTWKAGKGRNVLRYDQSSGYNPCTIRISKALGRINHRRICKGSRDWWERVTSVHAKTTLLIYPATRHHCGLTRLLEIWHRLHKDTDICSK